MVDQQKVVKARVYDGETETYKVRQCAVQERTLSVTLPVAVWQHLQDEAEERGVTLERVLSEAADTCVRGFSWTPPDSVEGVPMVSDFPTRGRGAL